MGYNAELGFEEKSVIPDDTILEGEVTEVKDGTVKDFVKGGLDKWKNADANAIRVTAQFKHGESTYTVEDMFTYRTEANGKVTGSAKSKLGKFHKKYGSLPKPGLKVKGMANAEGFLKIKIE